MEIEKQEKILELFDKGVNLYQIHKQTGHCKKTVKKVLLNYGIDYTEEKQLSKSEKRKKVIELYNSGKPQTFIEKELKMTRKTIREILKSSDVYYRTSNEAISLGHGNYINHNFLDDLTKEEVLYFIGIIYTDGHTNVDGNNNSIELSLHKDDKELLEKLSVLLSSNYKIYDRSDNCSKLRFCSEKMINVFKDLGFTSNKTLSLKPDERLKHSRHFWRGCVDGDGSLFFGGSKYKYPNLSIVGTIDTVQGFIDFIKDNNIESKRVVVKSSGKNLYQVCYSSRIALQIADLLYKDSKIYLERKYKKYLEFEEFYKAIEEGE